MDSSAVAGILLPAQQGFPDEALYRLGNIAFGKHTQFYNIRSSIPSRMIKQETDNSDFNWHQAIPVANRLEHTVIELNHAPDIA